MYEIKRDTRSVGVQPFERSKIREDWLRIRMTTRKPASTAEFRSVLLFDRLFG